MLSTEGEKKEGKEGREEGRKNTNKDTISTKMGVIKIISIDEYVWKLDPSYTAVGNIKWYSSFGK